MSQIPSRVSAATPLTPDRKSTRLNSSHTVIYTLSLHDALPIFRLTSFPPYPDQLHRQPCGVNEPDPEQGLGSNAAHARSEEHTSELQSHRDLHSFPTRRSSDLSADQLPAIS